MSGPVGPAGGRGHRQIHALTPGDHFSPRTGSAIPTVVDGLCRYADTHAAVLVAAGTYPDRYSSAEAIEYPMTRSMHSATRVVRLVDALAGRLGRPRPWVRAVLGQVLVDQDQWEPAHVIAHNAPQLVPLVSARHAAVLHAHNDLFRSYSRLETTRVLAPVHRIVCVSEWLAEHTRGQLAAHLRSRVVVVPNGVDHATFTDVVRPPRTGALRVVFMGRVLKWKGPDVLLRALVRLGRPDIHLTVIGSAGFDRDAPLTAYESQLRRLADDVAGPVTFLPFQERQRVVALLAQADVCVVPSVDPEPFGLVALEAMAAGVAVVAARSGGLPEAIGGAGLVVEPGDVGELAAALAALADDEGEVARLAAAGGQRARDMDWSVVAEQYARALG